MYKYTVDFGYMDIEDVEAENTKIIMSTPRVPRVQTEIIEEESGVVLVEITAPYQSDLVRYMEKFLGENGAISSSIIEQYCTRV